MNPYVLAVKSMRHRLGSVVLTVCSLALGIALLLGVERIRNEAKDGFTNTISGTDLIVGARSGSISLLLTSIFHIGHVTDNVSWETFQKVDRNPQVAWTIPLSLGDSHKGFPVLGTSNSYFKHYRYGSKQALSFSKGGIFSGLYDAVLGAEVAEKLGYVIGQDIVVAHGSGAISFVEHSENPFKVVGVLKPTGTPVDQTVHVMLEGIEAIHKNFDAGIEVHESSNYSSQNKATSLDDFETLLTEQQGEPDFTPTEITAFLVGMKSRADAVMLKSAINEHSAEALTGVIPGVALAELWQVVSFVEKVLFIISLLVLAISLSGLFTMLMLSFRERRREMAILRSLGARPWHIVTLVLGESVVVSGMAIILGVAVVSLFVMLLRPYVQSHFGIVLEHSILSGTELMMLGGVFCAGVLTALFPAWSCYRSSLSDGLTIKL